MQQGKVAVPRQLQVLESARGCLAQASLGMTTEYNSFLPMTAVR